MPLDPSFDACRAAQEAAAAARGRAMTAFEEHLADAVMHLAVAVEQIRVQPEAPGTSE